MNFPIENVLQCPICEGAVEKLTDHFVCTLCHEKFNIIDGIPIFVPSQKVSDLIETWKAVESQLSDYRLLTTPRIRALVQQYTRSGTGLALDVGCGTGAYFPYFRMPVIGIDIMLPFLLEARRRLPSAMLVCCDVQNMCLKSHSFNFVLCSEVMEHIVGGRKLINDLMKLLSSQSILLVDTPNTVIDGRLGEFREVIRRIIYGQCDEGIYELVHHSSYGKKDFIQLGLEVHGCVGWVTQERFKAVSGLFRVWDWLAWRVPQLGGTLIGIGHGKSLQQEASIWNY